ncbi:MAG: GNAT family N-acetyltransferase [Bacteroidota bacterium]
MNITIRTDFDIPQNSILALYEANEWSSAKKPDLLYKGLMNATDLVTAWIGEQLVGLGSALSDKHLVVYYPHLLVHPDFHGQGIGRQIMNAFQQKYSNFHQQILVANESAIPFYKRCGFVRAGTTESMWKYSGEDG